MTMLCEQEDSIGSECCPLQLVVKMLDVDDKTTHNDKHSVSHIKLMGFASVLFALATDQNHDAQSSD